MKAPSESGLWAMLFSLMSTAVLLMMWMGLRLDFYLQLYGEPLPTCHNPRRRNDLEHFSDNEPVESQLCGTGQRMCIKVQPADSTGEEQNFRKEPRSQAAEKGLFPTLHNVSGQPRHEGIGHQISACNPKNLRHSTYSNQWIKNRQAHRSFTQVQRQSGKSAFAAQQHAHQQNAKVLQGQRH